MSAQPPPRRERQHEHARAHSAAPRARPVAGLPLPTLAARSGETARRWAMALVATHPLDAFGAIPLEELAAGGPPLCEQLARALASDSELAALREGEGPARLASLCGSARPAALAEAVEALRGALWELLLEELPHAALEPGGARLLGDVSDRLAHACGVLLAVALDGDGSEQHGVAARGEQRGSWPVIDSWPGAGGSGGARSRRAEDPVARGEQPAGRGEQLPSRGQEPARRAEQFVPRGEKRPAPAPPGEPGVEPAFASSPPDTGGGAEPAIVIVDERRAAYASIERPPFRGRVAAVGPVESDGRRRSRAGGDRAESAETAGRAGRGEVGPAAWVGPIGHRLECHERDGRPFAVLLVELREDPPGGPQLDRGRVEDALAAELREGGGTLTRERPGRYWAVAPDAEGADAQTLAARLVRVIDGVAQRTGAATRGAVGTAICPEDGSQAATLAAQADLRLYEARPGRRD